MYIHIVEDWVCTVAFTQNGTQSPKTWQKLSSWGIPGQHVSNVTIHTAITKHGVITTCPSLDLQHVMPPGFLGDTLQISDLRMRDAWLGFTWQMLAFTTQLSPRDGCLTTHTDLHRRIGLSSPAHWLPLWAMTAACLRGCEWLNFTHEFKWQNNLIH